MHRRIIAWTTAAIVVALVGPSAGSTHTSSSVAKPSVGSSAAAADKPKVGAFIAGLKAVTYSVAEFKGLDQGTKETGISHTLFQGNLDPGTQFNQLQSAIQARRFNTYIIHPVSENLCKLVKDAIKQQKIKVIVINNPLCGQNTASGVGMWTPGTVSFIGGNPNYPGYIRYWSLIASKLPSGTKILSVTGIKQEGNSIAWVEAGKKVASSNSKLNIVDTLYTDYTTPTSLSVITAYLQAHPDVGAIVDNYVGITQGAVKAVEGLGLKDKVKIYDVGADTQDIALVKAGSVVATSPYFPVTMAKRAMESVKLIFAGKSVPRYIGDDGDSALTKKFLWITKANVGSFTPQY